MTVYLNRAKLLMSNSVTVSGTVPFFNHDTEEYVKVSVAPVCADYKVATDSAMRNVVTSGTAYTSSDIDYTMKVRLLLLPSPAVEQLLNVSLG